MGPLTNEGPSSWKDPARSTKIYILSWGIQKEDFRAIQIAEEYRDCETAEAIMTKQKPLGR